MTPPTPTPLGLITGAAREGFIAPGAEDFYWQPIWHLQLFGLDISINRTVLLTFLGTAIVLGLFLIAFRKPKLVPRGIQNLMEAGVDFVRDQIILPVMGRDGLVYLPYFTTLFFFIFMLNAFEVIPGANFPPTSRFGIPLVLALISFVLFAYTGVKEQGVGHYVKGVLFPPGVPLPLYIILTPVELVSTFVVRPFSLAVRLMANMVAGHLLLTVLFLGTAYLLGGGVTIPFGILSGLVSVVMVGFEIFVAALQAFIFVMLTAVYIAGSKEAAH